MKAALLALLLSAATNTLATPADMTSLYDQDRQRTIPIAITTPQQPNRCTKHQPCNVAFISAGYGVPHQEYQFISKLLTAQGYLSVAIRHELESDPPLSVSGNLYQTRQENWQRGAKTLRFVQKSLVKLLPNYDFNHVLLVGHSNGGDISSLLSNQGADFISGLITLDHRRVPLPRKPQINTLSIRASDFPADHGVLYSKQELVDYGGCVIEIPKAKHNDMTDKGPSWLKQSITKLLAGYLTNKSCEQLTSL
ncbi:alpha/beta hydrolase [Pseudoalteromonas luteoviolacea]|uniref:alpha/beta hydrolase n=1 Tax=Pseudoalteromonas luteoviolacea TaxID=43657 RepID=UPI00115418FF|nr:alpha/beta hydrolase [Pseudoalteromonas luteoviolacea]TQF68051.1 alpha/beta hydrolase [Pseudoalteromonas luteoviolacea]